ncbi:MAG: ribonuclease R [Lachnospiraceae bacterium]|nr:ribonuclease R [Lachnospiraceae bacterium]
MRLCRIFCSCRSVKEKNLSETGKETEDRTEIEQKDIKKNFRIVGTYEQSKNYGFVVPDNRRLSADVFIPKEKAGDAADGQKVVAEITLSAREEGRSPEGKIVEILGDKDAPGVDILSIVRAFELPEAFTEKELRQADRAAKDVSEADRAGRMDLRNVQMVTIDGEDAKDLDDAVSLSVQNGLYELGVHIADVSNYVQEYSALDRQALERGNSVYLPDRVIPMLPEALSNGICSLNAGEDRLALSCLMQIEGDGTVKDYRIVESVIRVDRRLTYSAVQKVLENEEVDDAMSGDIAPFVPMLRKMGELAVLLRGNREKRGSIDFDFPESKLILDETGNPLEIKPYERNAATKLIEEFMLLANETVAENFYWLDIPFLYRNHESPEQEKIRKLAILMRNMGFSMKTGREEIHPKEIQKLLWQAEGSESEALVSRLALRSMQQARYAPDCAGHFGLASRYYCHFTSPIRRYPDLQIHRIIKQYLREKLDEDKREHYLEILDAVASRCCVTERRANEAERECEKLKKAQYMEEHVGESFLGVVSGVTSFGIYVELENTVEGLVSVSDLPGDYYKYEESGYRLVGERTGRCFSLGQRLTVVVKRANKYLKYVDFALEE